MKVAQFKRPTVKSFGDVSALQVAQASEAIRATKLWNVIALGFERARLDDACALLGRTAPKADKFGLPPFPSCRGEANDATCDAQIAWYTSYNQGLQLHINELTAVKA